MNIDQILIFDTIDEKLFYPFSILHPIWELRAGTIRLFEKYEKLFPKSSIVYYSKNHLKLEHFLNKYNLKNIFLSKNTLVCPANLNINSKFISAINHIKENTEHKSIIFTNNNKPIAAFIIEDEVNFDLESFNFEALINSIKIKNHTSIEVENLAFINNLWELIDINGGLIKNDKNLFSTYKELKQDDIRFIAISGNNKVLIGENVKIEPFCFLNADDGDIIIDDNAIIKSHTMIQGACYIGKNTIIKSGAKIYENTSIGEFCKIGGEIENSIFQSFSNKQHDGFLGHSFISEWVNLGAGTNNSDLKNNYSEIKINIESEEISIGKIFFGMLMGDHSKSAIGSRFNTGSVIGICSNIFTNDFPAKHTASFTFGGEVNSPNSKLEKSIEIAKKVMSRRNKELLHSEILLMKAEYNKKIDTI